MPNNTYVLNKSLVSFTRPNNTTAYSAFTVISNGSPVVVPAPTNDRPFFIRRLMVQALPGMAATLACTLNIYSADVSAVTSFADGGFLAYAALGTSGLLESRTTFTFPALAAVSTIDVVLPTNYSLFCPTGVYSLSFETNAAYTPPANQRFAFELITEFGN